MNEGTVPSASVEPSSPDGGMTDEGRRYWKAAIAHLAPQKREAAWDFYLDRLESSAAADTLGGVMLLLEAHLAFFDDLPTRLGRAAQQIEAAMHATGQRDPGDGSVPLIARSASAASPAWRWRTWLVAGVSAVVGGGVVCAVFVAVPHRGAPALAERSTQAPPFWSPGPGSLKVEPWKDAATRRQRGAVISLDNVAWTEHTASGGATIYVLSPAEEVRRDLDGLRRTTN